MSIQSEIMRIASARDEIAAAIEAKGVPAAGTPLAGLAAKAAAIVQSMVKTVCGKAPDSGGNIALSAKDVGARPDTWTPTAAQVGAAPTTRKINGKALSADVTLTAADVGARASTWTPTAAQVGAVAKSAVTAIYGVAIAFDHGKATYKHSAVKATSVCIVQRRAGTVGVGNNNSFSTSSANGSLTIITDASVNVTINVNILILNL